MVTVLNFLSSLSLPGLTVLVVVTCTYMTIRLLTGSRQAEKLGLNGGIPCPWSWPFVGNLPDLFWAGYGPEKLMMKWAKEYGEIFSFQLGSQLVVVLNSFNLIEKAWHHPHLQDRSPPLVYIKALGEGKGEVLLILLFG